MKLYYLCINLQEMIKRSTAYFYILLTSFVLLAHAVIPHHYHESEIFIINPDCQTDNGVHKHGTTEHRHESHEETNNENCIIQQVVVFRSNQVRQEPKSLESHDNNSQIDGFQAFLFKKGLSAPFQKVLSNAYFFSLSSSYSTFASTCLGLRAPPPIV